MADLETPIFDLPLVEASASLRTAVERMRAQRSRAIVVRFGPADYRLCTNAQVLDLPTYETELTALEDTARRLPEFPVEQRLLARLLKPVAPRGLEQIPPTELVKELLLQQLDKLVDGLGLVGIVEPTARLLARSRDESFRYIRIPRVCACNRDPTHRPPRSLQNPSGKPCLICPPPDTGVYQCI